MSVQTSRCLALCAATVLLGCAQNQAGEVVGQPTLLSHIVQAGSVDPLVVDAVHRSTLIFDGTVAVSDSVALRLHGATVRVNQVIRLPEGLDSNLTGRRVIVIRPDNETVEPGERAVFFAYGRSAGSALVVKSVHRIDVHDAAEVSALVLPRIAAADSVLTDSTIWKAAQPAVAVVLVRIDSVGPVQVPDSIAALGSEQAPDWAFAFGEVLASFRARDSSFVHREITTLFPTGDGPFAEDGAQLSKGETRILSLSRVSRLLPVLRPGIDTIGKYLILKPEDARPSTDSARVARVLMPRPVLGPVIRPPAGGGR